MRRASSAELVRRWTGLPSPWGICVSMLRSKTPVGCQPWRFGADSVAFRFPNSFGTHDKSGFEAR